MASCPECGKEVSEGSQICIHCGAKFDAPSPSPPDNGTPEPVHDTDFDATDENGTEDIAGNDADHNGRPEGPPFSMAAGFKSTLKPTINRPVTGGLSGGLPEDNDHTPEDTDGIDPEPGMNSTPEPGVSGGQSSSFGGGSRNKWLEEQEKIKHELESLKGKISTGFTVSDTLDLKEEEEIFHLDDNEMESIKDASISLTPIKRPLTEEEEEKKQELLMEIKDLKAEGYDTSRLEKIVEIDPTSAWQEFVKYMDDIDTLGKLRKRYSELDTTGFERESEAIKSKLDNPDMINQIERELNALEEMISSGATESDQGGLRELIDAGKEAFKSNEFQKALNFYKSALKIDPNNREVEFYRKKTEAKLQAFTSMKGAAEAAPVRPAAPLADAGYDSDDMGYAAPAPQPAPGRPVSGNVRPASTIPAPKVKPSVPTGEPRPGIVTGANAEVKKPLSVSMTPKLPAGKKPFRPAIAGKKPLIKAKRVAMKKPLPTATPRPAAPQPPPASVAPTPASGNPAEVEALGFNAFINKEFEKALGYYEQVLALDPNFPGAVAQRDKCLEELGRK